MDTNNKIMFMIHNNQVLFLQNSNMDFREWYLSLDGDINNYDSLIRGFVIKDKMIFFKGNFNYDEEVINAAIEYSDYIKKVIKNDELRVFCGIKQEGMYNEWEPILELTEKDFEERKQVVLDDSTSIAIEKLGTDKVLEPMIEFKNDYEDPEFQKIAVKYTKTVFIICIILKVILVLLGKITIGGFDLLLILAQVGLLGFCIHGFKVNHPKIKIVSVLAALSLFLMFDLGDIILGAIYLFFVIDAESIKEGKSIIIQLSKVIKEKISKKKGNN